MENETRPRKPAPPSKPEQPRPALRYDGARPPGVANNPVVQGYVIGLVLVVAITVALAWAGL